MVVGTFIYIFKNVLVLVLMNELSFFLECFPSLVLGLTSGAIMGIGAYQTSNDPTDIYLSLSLYK